MTIKMRQALALLLAAAVLFLVVAVGLVLVNVATDDHTLLRVPSAATTPALASGYLYTSSSAVRFLQVTSDAHGKVSGIAFGTLANSDSSVSFYRSTFSGTISGAHLVLAFAGVGAATDTATLSDGGQVLTIEALGTNSQIQDNVYHAATIADYNAAVKALQGH
jgi:hypothetical protein